MKLVSFLYRPNFLIPAVLLLVGTINLIRSDLPQIQIVSVLGLSVIGFILGYKWVKAISSNTLFRMGLAALVTVLFTSLFGVCLGSLFQITTSAIGIFSLTLFATIIFLISNSVFESIFPDNKLSKRQSLLRKIILDLSALEDGRVVDLARSGLLDQRLYVPRSLPKELSRLSESIDENVRNKARKALEAFKRIETMPKIDLEFFDMVEGDGDLTARIINNAKTLNAYVLSNETPLSRKDLEEVPCISIDSLATALKPAPQRGEFLMVKILRLGKEAKQGVGYLEDGTMVVVNGGGDFLGKNVRAQVLSQKHSTTGKIIFCNVLDVEDEGIAFS